MSAEHAAGMPRAGVISRELLEKKAVEQAEGIEFSQLKTLSLHFLNIVKIDHLWMCENLTTLKLNGNAIEKIENLERLTCLTELNLAFNRISKIENIDKLTELKQLLLHSNKISHIEGLDTLHTLAHLSLNDNQLETLEEVTYLRQLSSLRTLNLEKNPLCGVPNYQNFILACLPQLIYYNHQLITERPECDPVHRQCLMKVEDEQIEAEMRRDEARKAREAGAELQEAYLAEIQTDTLLTELEQTCWRLVEQIGGEALVKIQSEHKEQVNKLCQKFGSFGLEQLAKRRHEMQSFHQCWEQACDLNRKESVSYVSEFLSPKESMYNSIRKILKLVEQQKCIEDSCDEPVEMLQEIIDQFSKRCQLLWKSLMALEIEFQEQIDDILHTFNTNLTAMMKTFTDHSRELFLQLQDLEGEFHKRAQAACQQRAKNLRLLLLHSSQGETSVGEEAIKFVTDTNGLEAHLNSCHNKRVQTIDLVQERLLVDSESWLSGIISDLHM